MITYKDGKFSGIPEFLDKVKSQIQMIAGSELSVEYSQESAIDAIDQDQYRLILDNGKYHNQYQIVITGSDEFCFIDILILDIDQKSATPILDIPFTNDEKDLELMCYVITRY